MFQVAIFISNGSLKGRFDHGCRSAIQILLAVGKGGLITV